jgi:hypothetical protein
MSERIYELSKIAYTNHLERNPHSSFGRRYDYDREFAELILRECTAVLFDESERLSALSFNEDSWQSAKEYEICSEQCINDIALIEKHFGVKE